MRDKELEFFAAEEELLAKVQADLVWLMDDAKLNRAELAKLLNVTKSRVTQILDEDGGQNLTLRLLARVFHCLGEKAEVSSARLNELYTELDSDSRDKAVSHAKSAAISSRRAKSGFWVLLNDLNDNFVEQDPEYDLAA